MAWSDRFEDPIALPAGRQIVSLEEAAHYITKLSKAEQNRDHWQTAAGILIATAKGRDFRMHARIAMLRALNHDKPAPSSEPRRKRAKAYRIIR